MKKLLLLALLSSSSTLMAQDALKKRVIAESDKIESKVIQWRRDFHQHPELGNQEVRTAKIVADHLRSLGIEVQEKVAFTGVVGILKGGKPGPVVALRADMDALPVTERVDVPFKSTVKAIYNEQETGVMHACGHDSHVAILMGVAEILAGMKKDLPGTVKFIFQPAEEGVQDKSVPFGADGMVKAGVLENPKVDVIFGLHINSPTPAGMISYKPGPTMAAVDEMEIVVKGKQTHGAYPWDGVDPVVTASQIVNGLQTIVSRNVKLIEAPAVVTVGAIHGGIRHNIIPESVKMIGTIRTLTREQRIFVHKRIEGIVKNIAEANQCEAEVKIIPGYPVTMNHEELTRKMVPTFIETVGKDMVQEVPVVMGAEDFSYYQEKVPGLFFFLGGRDPKTPIEKAAPHHTPDFYLDESGFKNGVRTFCNLVLNYAELHGR
ncbi:carboxypeptidase Ss1 [Leadbetterella byssophila DSM 17132]|uniref:Carboxypeptidase Ss1 n=1 Tax=Leadbetterella byssophila (strain DSM 17132 / JCM 16389 / KACC 11308 / NBRC 106382 / 4M15) TaxID=649349 RepID=E4RUC2_LEAB4|nr:amidohydrolase [Leadbetterella byssophila]ADQ16956.1 carboxypeptidase Ss1 [Leadbetterella byssophila DSM 17132]